MRELTDHIVSGDQAVQLRIHVLDEPGAGGANHIYAISGTKLAEDYPYDLVADHFKTVDGSGFLAMFQNGPIKEKGVNGITHETLLAIVIDRLRCFQAGPFACASNDAALAACKRALGHLQERTVERIARGVEGTTQK